MDVVALCVEHLAEDAAAVEPTGGDDSGVVLAGLAHHVDEAGLGDEAGDLADLRLLDRHRDGRVDVLAGLQRVDRDLPVRPPLGEDRDGVDVGGQQLLDAREASCEADRMALALLDGVDALGDGVHGVERVDLGMRGEELGEVGAELADPDDPQRERHISSLK